MNELREHSTEAHEAMLARLKGVNTRRHRLDTQDIEYWADRFRTLNIRFWVGIPLDVYMREPNYFERQAAENLALCRKEHYHRCLAVGKLTFVRVDIYQN